MDILVLIHFSCLTSISICMATIAHIATLLISADYGNRAGGSTRTTTPYSRTHYVFSKALSGFAEPEEVGLEKRTIRSLNPIKGCSRRTTRSSSDPGLIRIGSLHLVTDWFRFGSWGLLFEIRVAKCRTDRETNAFVLGKSESEVEDLYGDPMVRSFSTIRLFERYSESVCILKKIYIYSIVNRIN